VELTQPPKTNPANERFAAHLFRQQLRLFTYLRIQGIDATNYRAEQALKMPIVNRKVWAATAPRTAPPPKGSSPVYSRPQPSQENRPSIGSAVCSAILPVLRC